MINMVMRLIAPAAIKQCLAELESLATEIAEPPFPKEIIDRTSSKFLRRKGWPTYVKAVDVEGMKPQNIAMYLLYQDCYDSLCSGNYHSYRGALGMSGNAILKAFNVINTRLVEASVLKPEVAEEDCKALKEGIKAAG